MHVKKSKKLMKVVSIDGENLLNGLRNSNKIFRKDMTYYNVKSYKKPELYSLSLSRIYIFRKTTAGKGKNSTHLKIKLADLSN